MTPKTYQEFESVATDLLTHGWIYAKTMPQWPHEYTLRKQWSDDRAFVQAVEFIREHGYQKPFYNRVVTYLDVNEHKYWTMGAPVPDTILINRAVLTEPVPYDAIAPVYDALLTDQYFLEENSAVIARLGDMSNKSVIDIGCGTGLLLDYVTPGSYTGVDPSREMLRRLVDKHPDYSRSVVRATLARFHKLAPAVAQDATQNETVVGSPEAMRYDVAVALFGAAGYLSHDEVERIPTLLKPGGRFFLMFYADEYVPVTYIKSGITVSHYRYDHALRGEESRMNGFIIVEGCA